MTRQMMQQAKIRAKWKKDHGTWSMRAVHKDLWPRRWWWNTRRIMAQVWRGSDDAR